MSVDVSRIAALVMRLVAVRFDDWYFLVLVLSIISRQEAIELFYELKEYYS